MPARPFAQVDVFGSGPQSGNPVAVVLDAEDLTDEEMQRFANWTNLSETTFVLAPTTDEADYRVRIFTPSTELPFAGHPTLGTCHAWLQRTPGHDGDRIVQECPAGLVEVRRTEAGLAFAAPPVLRSGPVEEDLLADTVAALGIERDAVLDAQWVDNGPGWMAVLLGSVDEVLALEPEYREHYVGAVAVDGDDALEVRAFFPVNGALAEDPVTGSLNASVAEWLLRTGRLAVPYVARQGTALGRAGRVHLSRDDAGAIWVGGDTVTAITGEVTLP
jgi:PhzF family phenazine biosynthesis protein